MNSERREEAQQKDHRVYKSCKEFLHRLPSLKEAQNKELLDHVNKIGEVLAKKVRMSQLRRVLDAFEKIRSAVRTRKGSIDISQEVQLLKIHLAYAAGRQNKLKPLHEVLSRAIDKVQDLDDFKKLSQFIEGLVAYHKFHGGEE
ncbi:type III-A CRISPR-associated protein Csm2 [bacterium]|nr:type III-A CRISPR-associated protein Csm2 [bacterium]